MRIAITKPLFAWDCLEDSPSLATIKAFLASIPDGKLLDGLRLARGRGRNDYPVQVLWGVVLLTIALRHTGWEACLGELRRNEALRRLIGIESEKKVPLKWNVSRFLDVLGQEPHWTQRAGDLRPADPTVGPGRRGSGKRHRRRRHGVARPTETGCRAGEGGRKRPALPQASGGKKEYFDDEGKVTKVFEWFGYKLHLIVDVKHEVALAWQITTATASDAQTLPTTLAQAQGEPSRGPHRDPGLRQGGGRPPDPQALGPVGDQAADRNALACGRRSRSGCSPATTETPTSSTTSKGTIYCYDRTSQPMVRQRMAYIGYEPKRGTLKYRCPARHEGWICPHDAVCNAGKDYGRTLRVKCEIDLRRFPPIPRATHEIRASLRRPHGGRAGQRPAEDLLGR